METKESKPKKPFYKRWWFWVLAAFVFLIIISSGGDSSKSGGNSATANTPAQQAQAIQVTASQLVKDYEANEVAADAKYKGNMVEVSGTIQSIGKDLFDAPYVALNGNSPSMIFNVQCFFEKSEQAQLATLTKDTKITLRGKVNGKMGNVLVKECAILK